MNSWKIIHGKHKRIALQSLINESACTVGRAPCTFQCILGVKQISSKSFKRLKYDGFSFTNQRIFFNLMIHSSQGADFTSQQNLKLQQNTVSKKDSKLFFG